MKTSVSPSTKISEIDALRALSIIFLMAVHSGVFDLTVFGFLLEPLGPFFGSFLLGSFFFLAGYFSDVSFHKREQGLLPFLWSKFIRIYPPYWLALGAFVLVLGYSLKPFDAAVYALNLQFLFAPAFAKQILTLWYVSLIAVYYFIFGIPLSRKSSNINILIWSVIIFGATFTAHIFTDLFDGRFFEYFFIFLAGIYYSRFSLARERIVETHISIKFIPAMIGVWFFWLKYINQVSYLSWQYLLIVDFYILVMILLWLGIFRSSMGKWKIWAYISYASFFAYLFHRPIWEIIQPYFPISNYTQQALFRLFPASVVVFIAAYFLQVGYDRLLAVFRQNK